MDLTGSGTQTALAAAPGPLDFGDRDTDAGPTPTSSSTLTNTGTEPVTLSGLTLGGADAADFELLDGEPGDCATALVLTASQTCALRVTFDPAALGAKSASLTVASNAADVVVGLSGTGTGLPVFGVAPATRSFGSRDVADGPTASETFTVTNSGNAPLAVSGVALAGSDASEFAISSNGCTGPVAARGGTCDVTVTFDPSSAGAKTAELRFTHDAAGSPSVATLSGTGTVPEPPAPPDPGPPAPPAPPVPPTPGPTPPPSPPLIPSALVSGKLLSRVDAKGRVALMVACTGPRTCAGSITVQGGRPLRKFVYRRVTVAANRTVKVTLRLDAKARRLLARLGKTRAEIVVSYAGKKTTRVSTLAPTRR